MKINALTSAEETLMQIMWQCQSAYLKDIVAQYPQPAPHRNTVSTFVKILVDKKFLTKEKEGRIFKYHVAVPYDAYRIFLLDRFLDNYFGGSADALLQMLTHENYLSKSDPTDFPEVKGNSKGEKKNPMQDFVEALTADKSSKKKDKKKKKKKKSRDR